MAEAGRKAGKDTGAALRSMTGFASVTVTDGAWRIASELRSVNGRGLELRLRAPDWIDGLEPAARKAVQARLTRGNVTLSIRVAREQSAVETRLNEAALDAALGVLRRIADRAGAEGLVLSPPTAADVAAMRGVIDAGEAAEEDTGPLREAILAALDDLLDLFDADRAREGAALAAILAAQIDEVERLSAAAAAAAGDRAEAARAAMERGLARLLDVTEIPDESRMMQELALIAVKTDVTEELDRLGAHVAAARGLLRESGAIGRKFDFLMQEFNREANTLCSKAQSAALTGIGLDLKAVIDQMREQVQNIE